MELRRSETKILLINWHKSKGYIISWKKKRKKKKRTNKTILDSLVQECYAIYESN